MVAVLVPLLATHSGQVAESARPQGLTSPGSVSGALPGTSETRSTSANAWRAVSVSGSAPTAGTDTSGIARTIVAKSAIRPVNVGMSMPTNASWQGYRQYDTTQYERGLQSDYRPQGTDRTRWSGFLAG